MSNPLENLWQDFLTFVSNHKQTLAQLPAPTPQATAQSSSNTVAVASTKAPSTSATSSTDEWPSETIHSLLDKLGVLWKQVTAFETALVPGEWIGANKPGTSTTGHHNPIGDLMDVQGAKAKQANDYSYAHSSYCMGIRAKQTNQNLPVSPMTDVDAAAQSGNYSKIAGA